MTTKNAIIRLRRDNDYNYNKIKDTFIPASGEVVLVDTAHDGLRAKVGDGYSTYAQLQFTDADLRNAALQGYFFDGQFYKNEIHDALFPAMINKIYIDLPTSKIYYYNGQEYVIISTTYNNASNIEPGIVKLYNTLGNNIDGTIT